MPINEVGTIYTPSIYGRTSFPLKHKTSAIFYKIFNSEDSSTVNIVQDTINIPNHFFKTGEPLAYNVNDSNTDTPIGISTLSPGAGGTISQFPNIVYPIVIDKNNIRVALGSTYALANEYVNISSLGIGTEHSLEAFKQNSKCLVSINNIIQSPISVGSTVQVLSYTPSSLVLESLRNIKLGTCLKINDEIVRISSVNYDTKEVSLSRGPQVLGTNTNLFTNSLVGSYIDVLSGNYNIIKDIIYFDEPPLEGRKINYRIPSSDIVYSNYSFNLLTDILQTGSQVLVIWSNPPQEIPIQKFYYLIKNSENNFSFAENFANAINDVKVTFSNISDNEFPVSNFEVVFFYPSEENSFNGRVFLRSNYDANNVFDDVSEQFTGISSSFELKISGISTVGISSDNGILLVNNIFQYPGSNEAFSFSETASETFVNFVGFGTTGFTGKDYDVNVKGYPRGGIIVSYGTTSGGSYQLSTSYYNVPVTGSISGIGASVSFNTDEYGNVKEFKFTNRGYNYKVGEILIPTNATGLGTQTSNDKIHITINEVTKDTFNAWNIGILEKLDDLSDKVNGVRRTFDITKNSQRISLDTESESEVELQYNLLIFVNDVLQIPNSSYIFNSGSIITFTEPIPTGSNVKVYFYRGYTNDSFNSDDASKLKEGDSLVLLQDIYNPPPLEQNDRIIKQFVSADVLRTNIYSDLGLSENSSQLRSITWTPQKKDLIIDGTFVSKSRDEQNSGITSFTKIATYVGTFSGVSTNTIGVTTTSILIGDYVEGTYVGTGVSIVSIGSSIIGIGSTSYSSSPVGVNTSLLSFYRKS
jgi:hypothetical protein